MKLKDKKLRLRRFSDYHNYLMDEEDKRWDLYDGKEVIPVAVVEEEITKINKELKKRIVALHSSDVITYDEDFIKIIDEVCKFD